MGCMIPIVICGGTTSTSFTTTATHVEKLYKYAKTEMDRYASWIYFHPFLLFKILGSLTSYNLHNAIMEAGGKDRPPMLAPDKEVPISEGSSVTTTETYMDNYKNVSQDIHDQLNAKAEAVQIILTGIDNNIYFTSQELKIVSYHKLYDILKQHQNEVNEIRAERIARTANPLALVAQQQPVYHPQNYPTHYTQNSLTRSQQAATRNRGKAIVNSPPPIYDQEPSMVAEDDEMLKDKEIDKLVTLISLSFKKIYEPTNNNLRTSSNTSRANQDNSPRINRGAGYDNQRLGNVAGDRETVGTTVVQKSGIQFYNCKEFGHVASECQKPKRAKDAAYHKEKILLCKWEEAEIQLNAEQADWKDDIDDESEDQESEAHYMYMAQIQEVTLDATDSGPIFDSEPLQKNDDDDDLANERELLASLIEKLKCEIDDSKNRNKFLETSNKKDLKKFQAELDRRNDVEYASKVEIDCAKAKGDLISYKMESQKSFNKYTQQISNLNQTISEMKKKLFAHKETISILSQAKEAQIKLYKTREAKELDKVIALENKVKVLDNIVYKTGQSVQTINMLNSKFRTSFAKPEFLKKAQRANPRLYDIGCYNNNLALMLAPETDEDKMPIDVPVSTRKPKRTVKQSIAKPLKKTVASESNQKPRNTTKNLYERVSKACSWWYPKFTPPGYKWKLSVPMCQILHCNLILLQLVEIVLFIVDSGCSKHITGNLKLLINFVEKFLGMVKFGNDQSAPILGYGDLVQGAVTIKRVYYVEGLNHNLFSVGQFCDADLKVAFRKSTCYIRDLKGNDLLTGSRSIDLYSITLQDTNSHNPICLMVKAASSQAWLWHRRLSQLNFDTINLLSKNDIVVGLPKLKFVKDHLYSSCELKKAKRKSFQSKTTLSSKRRL
uniref:Retrovirus-related Pol polyprotein from transposon TNT 1-94 n=1 Tax=Tanacetum cinerariifolium TaxID=118510 RepID=A0A6L2JCE3_TANCI|nr:retrovirus-related Pol polyprotein from transposon TNT 1-94 [Tanacetum cinerariifolium]